jgi:hypothetical protein
MDSCPVRAHLEGCDHYSEVQVSTLRGAEEQDFEPKMKMDWTNNLQDLQVYIQVSHKLKVGYDHQKQ